MKFLYTDQLQQELLSNSSLDNRTIVWLWLKLGDYDLDISTKDFGAPDMCQEMADHISRNSLSVDIEFSRNYSLLPEHELSWIKKTGRQPAWLLQEYLKDNRPHPQCPTDLTQRDKLIALLDYAPESKSSKQSILYRLKTAWIEREVEDKDFDWYKKGSNETQKCEAAWLWYQENHGEKARSALKFSKLENVLTFLDGTHFTLGEKLYHLEQIKKKLKAQQTQANRQGRMQTNLSLSEEARLQLDGLASKERRTKTEVIELLIQNAHERGMPTKTISTVGTFVGTNLNH